MTGEQAGPPTASPLSRFSPDGFWWWGGAQWRPAMSPDRLWRWNGQGWIPAAAGPPSSQSHAVGITVGLVAGFLGIILVVVLLVLAILYTMGGQIANVFSNVAAALGP